MLKAIALIALLTPAGVSLPGNKTVPTPVVNKTPYEERREDLKLRLENIAAAFTEKLGNGKYAVKQIFWSRAAVDEEHDGAIVFFASKNGKRTEEFVLVLLYRDGKWQLLPDDFYP